MFELILKLKGSITFTPYIIQGETYIKITVLHDHLELTKFIHNKYQEDEGFMVFCTTKALNEILDYKEEKNDGD